MKYHFITFGNEPWYKSVDQLCKDARELNIFESVRGYTDADLSEEDRTFANENPRGYGFWRWKSAICLLELERIEAGDVVLYADAGCVFNPPAKMRLLEYIPMALEHGFVGFQMSHIERVWTKRELIQLLRCEHRTDVLDTGQIEGTAFVFAKTPHAERILRTWNAIPKLNPVVINDQITLPQDQGFREHRHDQSILSILLKLHGAKQLGWETWCWGENESEYRANPLWEMRRKLQ
jgi:hypothetical protein